MTAHRWTSSVCTRLFAGMALVLALTSCADKKPALEKSSGSAESPRAALDPAALDLRMVSPDELAAMVREPGHQATLVNVWASWCEPCREEFPDLVKFARAHKDKGLNVVFVSADFSEDLPNARAFLAQQGVDWPTYFKSGDDMQFIRALGDGWSGALPGSFVYDADGKLARWWEGKASYAALEERVLPVLRRSMQPDTSNTLEDRS